MASEDDSLAIKNFRPSLKLDRLLGPFHRFMDVEASGGIILLLAALAALFLANTSLNGWYNAFWSQHLKISLGDTVFEMSVLHIVNDGLMTLFFFVVGLEIKREVSLGEFRNIKAATFPIIGAIGGMLMPAFVYFLIDGRGPGAHGWAIPMATDIAFVVGFLSLLGKRVPHSLKITLLTLAIADDIGAIFVIAFVYSKSISFGHLGISLGFYALVFALNYLGVRRFMPYVLAGLAMWFFLMQSGIHPSIAGVLLGLATPARKLIDTQSLKTFMASFTVALQDERDELDREPLRLAGREANAPLERLETDLHPWVSFLIMPLFAFANAGVPVQLNALESATAWAVILGLLLGKPLGIFGLAWLAEKAKLIQFPADVSHKVFVAASCLGGVGFTMSIFIANLALENELLAAAKIGTLLGSALSACLGLFLLHRFLDRRELLVALPLLAAALPLDAGARDEGQDENGASGLTE